jgi:hypothetical protein
MNGMALTSLVALGIVLALSPDVAPRAKSRR